jgi:SAM-dependent methyltransferase
VDWPLSEHGEDHLDVQCDISEALPLGTASFDTVILSDVLEHIPEPDKLWAEISRILRPRGRIIMNVPFMYWVHESPHDYYRYTEFALRRFVERNDLRVVSLNPIGHAPAVLADVFGKLLVRIPLIGPTATHLLQEAFLLLLSIGPVDRLFRRTAAAFPSGYFVIAEKP